MNIIKKRVYGYYDYYDRKDEYFDRLYAGDWYWEMMINSGLEDFGYLEEVKKDLAAIKILIDSDFKDLSDEDFYYLISRFYYIDLTVKDFLNIISRVNHVQYDKFEELRTRQTFKVYEQEGCGKDFSWWEETYQVGWIVATAKNFRLKPNYNYSKEEIENMTLKKQFVSIYRRDKDVGMDPKLPYKQEKYEDKNMSKIADYSEEFKCVFDTLVLSSDRNCDEYMKHTAPFFDGFEFSFDYLKEGETEFSKAVYKEACSMIRMRLNKKQVLDNCKKIIVFLNNELNNLVTCIQESYYSDKDKYLNLSEELKASHKTLLLKIEGN